MHLILFFLVIHTWLIITKEQELGGAQSLLLSYSHVLRSIIALHLPKKKAKHISIVLKWPLIKVGTKNSDAWYEYEGMTLNALHKRFGIVNV